MKVVPKPSILARISKEIGELSSKGREPDYIVLTRKEFDELRNEVRVHTVYRSSWDCLLDKDPKAIGCATFVAREFPLRPDWKATHRGAEFIRVPQEGTLFGHPLFVVPPEYHP